MEARSPSGRRGRRLSWALALSAALHATLFWFAFHAPPLERPPPQTSVELEIHTTAPTVEPPKAAPAPKAIAKEAKRRKSEPPRTAANAPAPTEEPTAAIEQPPAAVVTDVPRALDLTVHSELAFASEGGATTSQSDGGADENPSELHAGLGQTRIQGWLSDDMAERRVETGRVDDWFMALGKSIERALAKDPPPPGGLKKIASQKASEYQSSAEAFGGEISGEGAAVGDVGPTSRVLGNSGRMHTPEGAATLWAIVEVDYRRDKDTPHVRILSSSGDASFNEHVMKVIARGPPGLPGLSPSGFGIHPEGTRSVWQVEGHLSFERDLRSFKLKEDGWYAPVAAATAAIGAFSGNPQINDYRHPHIDCNAKLLRVY